MKSAKERLREMLAEQVHVSWSGWVRYQLVTKGIQNEDGSVTVPKEFVERWTRQMKTTHDQLPEEEKSPDRTEADSYISVIEKWLKSIGESK